MGKVTIARPGDLEDLVLEVEEIHEMVAELTEAGWVRVGPFWKQPGDQGPTGRKWNPRSAHQELLVQRQREAEQAAAAKKTRSRKKKS